MKGSVRVLFFSALREFLQSREMWVQIEEGVQAGDLLDCLKSEYPQAALLFEQARTAVNHKITGREQTLKDGDEIALLLPVSGG